MSPQQQRATHLFAKRLSLTVLGFLAGITACQAQIQGGGVTPEGAITPGHCTKFGTTKFKITDAGACGAGSVSSVGLALPSSVFSVTGSPVTTSGTLTGSFVNQSANTVFAGPTSGGAATPAFRSLVNADVPDPITISAYRLNSSNLVTESTTARTLSSSDNGKTILCTNASATTITVPSGLGSGFTVTVIQMGAGQVGFTPSSTTINSFSSLTHIVGQYGGASLISTSTDVFVLTGGLS